MTLASKVTVPPAAPAAWELVAEQSCRPPRSVHSFHADRALCVPGSVLGASDGILAVNGTVVALPSWRSQEVSC